MKNKRILIVEDHYSNGDMMREVLQEDGYEVHFLQEETEFFEAVSKFQPDLIILDIKLRHFDGRLLCNEMASDPMTGKIPVIMVSALLESSFHDIPCPAVCMFSKPFDIDTLSKKIQEILYPD